jgi:hypothetical protein
MSRDRNFKLGVLENSVSASVVWESIVSLSSGNKSVTANDMLHNFSVFSGRRKIIFHIG